MYLTDIVSNSIKCKYTLQGGAVKETNLQGWKQSWNSKEVIMKKERGPWMPW